MSEPGNQRTWRHARTRSFHRPEMKMVKETKFFRKQAEKAERNGACHA